MMQLKSQKTKEKRLSAQTTSVIQCQASLLTVKSFLFNQEGFRQNAMKDNPFKNRLPEKTDRNFKQDLQKYAPDQQKLAFLPRKTVMTERLIMTNKKKKSSSPKMSNSRQLSSAAKRALRSV